MGQQQTVAGSTLLRRMVLALAIAAVMAAMVLATTAPAFAKSVPQVLWFTCVARAEADNPDLSSGDAHKNCTPPNGRS